MSYSKTFFLFIIFAVAIIAATPILKLSPQEIERWAIYEEVGKYLIMNRQADDVGSIEWLANSNKIGLGYNPIRGDPVCYTGDCAMAGFGRSIFQLNYTKAPIGSCLKKKIPQNVELVCIPSTEVRSTTERISTTKQLEESTNSGVAWSFGIDFPRKVAFSYGQSKQSTFMLNNIHREDSSIFHSYARASHVKLSMFEPLLELSKEFRYIIEKMSVGDGTYSPAMEKYIHNYIFEYFGLTYINELLLGGIAQTTIIIRNEQVVSGDEQHLSSQALASLRFAEVFNAGLSEQNDETKAQLESFDKTIRSFLSTTMGGSIYESKQSLTEWFGSIAENPVVIKFTLSSIFDLLTQQRFPNDTKINQKSALIKRAFTEYLNKTSVVYCENNCTNSTQGTCAPENAYGYGLCRCYNGYTGFDCSKEYPTTPQPTMPPTAAPPARAIAAHIQDITN